MKQRILKGVIHAGVGAASKSLSSIFEEIKARSGLALVPGTLNVKLQHWYPGHLDIVLLAHEYGHHEHLFLEHCVLFGKAALILRTSTNHHGPSVLELMATEQIKDRYAVNVGAEIDVTVFDRGKRAKEWGRNVYTQQEVGVRRMLRTRASTSALGGYELLEPGYETTFRTLVRFSDIGATTWSVWSRFR